MPTGCILLVGVKTSKGGLTYPSMEECYDGLPFAAGSSSTRSSYASCFTFATCFHRPCFLYSPSLAQPSFTVVQFIAAEHVASIQWRVFARR